MKNIKYFVGLVIFLITMNVYAIDECSTNEMNRLKELANNVEIKYNQQIYEIKEDGIDSYVEIEYNINVYNLSNDLKLFYKSKDSNLIEVDLNEINDLLFEEGEIVNFEIYSWVNNLCVDTKLRTIKVEFPVYNDYYYYHKEKCNGYEGFKYCNEFTSSNDKTFSEIDKLYDEYINNEKKSNKDIINIDSYFIYIAATVFFLILIIVIILIKNKRKKKVVKI